jgi:ELWxxDGT repeat protein
MTRCLFALAIWLPVLAAGPATRVIDINTNQTNPAPAPNDSSTPQHLLAIGNMLYFSADDGSRGREPWKSNGSAGNASIVKNIRPGSAAFDPADLIAYNGTLFFSAIGRTRLSGACQIGGQMCQRTIPYA